MMKNVINYSILLMTLLIFLFLPASCSLESAYLDAIGEKIQMESHSNENPDETIQDDVGLTILTAGNGQITIEWTDPTEPTYDHVGITWSPNGESIWTVNKGTNSFTLQGLDTGTRYTITVTAFSESYSQSGGATISITLPAIEYPIFCISTAEELNNIRTSASTLGEYYLMTGDIDLAAYTLGEGWEPIGDDIDAFTGTLDGNGYSITNLTIKRTTDFNGLFGYISTGTVQYLRLVDVDIDCQTYNRIGALVGYTLSGTTIKNVSVTGSVIGDGVTGGIVGNLAGTVSSSYSNVSVTSNSNEAGGLAAGIEGGTILNCYSRGMVSAGGSGAGGGGLVGASGPAASSITNSYSVVGVTADNPGGIIGEKGGSTVNNSYYNRDVETAIFDGYGVPMFTAEMKTSSTYSGWDYSDIWSIDPNINDGYPYLTGMAP
jgi:Fibronectin type III domain